MTGEPKMGRVILLPRPAVVLMITLVVAGISGGLIYIYLPHAVVIITPAVVNKTVSQQILVSTSSKEPDFVKYELPAKLIEQEATDKLVYPRPADVTYDDYARGKVTLYNDQADEQQLLPKTHLRHQATGQYFLTDTGVAIPPRGEIGITVTAKEKGAAGNVKAGRFSVDKLPASLQAVVFGESSQSFSGGVSVEKPVTQEEIEAAKDKLRLMLTERVRGKLGAETGGVALREELISFTSEIEAAVPVGSKASQFEVAGKVTGQAFRLDENDLLALTLLKLRSAVELGQEFIEYEPRSFNLIVIRRDPVRGEAVVEGSLTGAFAVKLGATIFNPINLAGLSAEEAREKLKQLPGVGEAAVKLTPWWVAAIPARAGSVEIVVANN